MDNDYVNRYYFDDEVDQTDDYLFDEPPEEQEPEPQPDNDSKKSSRRRAGIGTVVVFIMGLIAGASLIYAGAGAFGLGSFVASEKLDYYHSLDSAYGKYYEIVKMIGEDPLAKSTPDEINDEDIKALVAETEDPYAAYYTSDEYAEFEKQYIGSYVGVGIAIADVDGAITIYTVFEDGPAYDAGIETGDVIKTVDGKTPESVDDAVDMMTGEAGTSVEVTVQRDGKDLAFTMDRRKMEIPSVSYDVVEEDKTIGYISISSFRDSTDDDFKLAIKDLKKKGCEKFIIDLRNNGGGLTDVSIDIADYLLPACRIMTDVKKDGSETVYNSKASSAELDLVVLVNGYTASASEILTGAIKDNHAGTVIGSTTYGKGVTQLSRRFSDGSVIKLTESEYFRPNGDKVNGKGIEPDIEAEDKDILEVAIEELNQ